MKTWKRAEKRVAEILGGQRVGNTGKATEDVRTRWLRVEVKTRKGFPLWIKRALAQVLRTTGPSQLGIVVLHEKGQRYDDSLVVLRLKDFQEWFGDVAAE